MRQVVATLKRYRSVGQPLLLIVAAAVLCALAVSGADRPLAGVVRRGATPALVDLANALISATFPVALVLVAVLAHRHAAQGNWLGRKQRQKKSEMQYALAALSTVLAAGSAAILQPVFGRTGPAAWIAHGFYGFDWFDGSMGLSTFPSMHAAGVGAIAAAAWMMVPAYRPTVALLTGLAAGCQVVNGSHFLGDQVAGVAIGWGVFEAMRRLAAGRSGWLRRFS